MAGMFDDLVPQGTQGGGLDFSDLIPKDKMYGRHAGDGTGAFISGAADAASFGLGDELGAAIGAPFGYLADKIVGKEATLGDVYRRGLENSRMQNRNIQERNPIYYGAGQVAGAVGTGLAGAGTKAGAKALSIAGRGLLPDATTAAGQIANFGTKALASGAIGAAQGGAYGFGSGEGDDRINNAEKGAAIGGLVGGAVPAIGAIAGGIAKEAKGLMPATAQSSKELRAAASPLYEQFAQSGATFSPKLTNEIADLAEAAKANGIAGATKKSDEALNEALNFYSSLRGKALGPEDLQKLDQSFADDISRFNRAGEYNFGRKLNDLKYELRSRAFDPENASNYISGGSPEAVNALKDANGLWSQSYKAKDIEKILAKAQGTENPQTSIRTGIKNLLANDKKMVAYSDEERALLQEAMKRGYAGGLVKLLGGRLTDSIAGGVAGLSAGGPVGAIAGTVAGKAIGGGMADLAGGIQANRLRTALGAMQSGAPEAQAVNPLMATVGNTARPALGEASSALSLPKAAPQTVTNIEPLSQNYEVPAQPQQPQQQAVTPDFLQKLATVESGGKANAQAPTSSAKGLFQFTKGTWSQMVKKYGAQTGISEKDILNPEAQMTFGAIHSMENESGLTQALGHPPSHADLYAAHFLGLGGAKKLIASLGSGQPAAQLFPDAARANRSIFYDKLRPRTTDEVYRVLQQKIS